MKLCWTVKQWEPGITTYNRAGEKNGCVFVALSDGAPTVPSPFKISHAAAAEWAANRVGDAMTNFARAIGYAFEEASK